MKYTFVDLCAGIGGIRLAFEAAGCKCVFSSEIDSFACQTYQENFGEIPSRDLMKINENSIPDHAILTAGLPCQPFSLAGVSKRMSLNIPHGFECRKSGRLFFKVVKILKIKKPKAFFLENVKNLVSHDGCNTFRIVRTKLENAGYDVFWKVIDSRTIVPQHRERVYIVGFEKSLGIEFSFPEFQDSKPKLADILDVKVDPKYTLSDKLWKYLQDYAETQRNKGNGFGYGSPDLNGVTRTLSARYHKDGAEILIQQKGKNPRRLTPKECSRLMGFPSTFVTSVSDTQAYKQFGNSVVVPIVKEIAAEIVSSLYEKECTNALQITHDELRLSF
jgi:DNA (cytosine-5)-methyltransferase 1